jgi:hypothetical protein
MKLTYRDGIAAVFVTAIIVPYVGYLVRGEMPFIQDPRGMSAIALVLGAAAFLTAGRISAATMTGRVEIGAGLCALVLGIVTVTLAETAAAEVLLGVFVGAVVVVWAIQMLHHAGVLTGSMHAPLAHR